MRAQTRQSAGAPPSLAQTACSNSAVRGRDSSSSSFPAGSSTGTSPSSTRCVLTEVTQHATVSPISTKQTRNNNNESRACVFLFYFSFNAFGLQSARPYLCAC